MGLVHARRHQPAAPRQEIFRLPFHHLRQRRLDRLCRRHRPDRRPRSARDGEVRSGRDLGHQSGQHPGQRDDARDARPQGARRQDRRGRRLHERHDGAGRSRRAGEARHRRRARLRGDALPVPRRQGRLGLSRKLHRRAARAGSACAHARPAMGVARSPAVRSRPSRSSPGWSARPSAPSSGSATASRARATAPVNMHAASCIPAVTGAWLHEGGGAFHNNADIYHWDKSMIEGTRRARQVDAHARPVAHRRDPHRRPRGAEGRPAGHGDADPEHQSGVGLPGSGQGQARLCARGPVRLRARAVHDRDREDGRRGAAGDHVPRARRRLSGRRPPIHHPRAQADRAAGRVPLQSRGDLRAGQARRRRASGLRHERARADRLDAAEIRLGHAASGSNASNGSTASRTSRPRITSRASTIRTANSASSRTGRRCRSAGAYHAGPIAAMPTLPDHWTSSRRPTTRIRSGSRPRRRAASSIRPSTRRRPRGAQNAAVPR